MVLDQLRKRRSMNRIEKSTGTLKGQWIYLENGGRKMPMASQ